jgi:hypothetical protein
MATVHKSAPVTMRELTPAERERAFSKAKGYSLIPYVDAVREMEGGMAYALVLNGLPATALKRRMNMAATSLDLKLSWARSAKGASELIVELGE